LERLEFLDRRRCEGGREEAKLAQVLPPDDVVALIA
jgi:hypothetical protein